MNPMAYATVAEMATNGSPMLLNAVGRAFGLGADEQSALRRGLPWWLWLVAGTAAGIAAGAYAAQKWPEKVPSFLRSSP